MVAQFVAELIAVARLICLHLEMYAERVLFVRCGLMKGFRFQIFYVVNLVNGLIDVISVLYQKQDPNIILERLNLEF